jgi:ectoine hydroxylase
MQLSADQLRDFDEQGYLFFPNCFSEEEIALLRDDAEAILKLDRQEVWREKTGAPRTAFAAHTFNETFRLLASHPRLVEPLRQLFGEDVYVHQFKLNARPHSRAMSGSGIKTTARGRATMACRKPAQ